MPMQQGRKIESRSEDAPKLDTKVEEVIESADWTADQQAALERALAKYPGSMPANERWTKIAEDVPGRTKKECVARFKWIREKVVEAKATVENTKKATEQKAVVRESNKQEREEQERTRLENERQEREMQERKRLEREERRELEKQEYVRLEEEKRKQEQEKEEQEEMKRAKLIADQARRMAEEKEANALRKGARSAAVEAQRLSRSRPLDANELETNHQKQQDELLVLESIFPDRFKLGQEDGVFNLRLGRSSEGVCGVELKLPPEYPSLYPPQATFSNLPLGCDEAELCEHLEACFVENVGEVMLYDWLEELQRRLHDDGSLELL